MRVTSLLADTGGSVILLGRRNERLWRRRTRPHVRDSIKREGRPHRPPFACSPPVEPPYAWSLLIARSLASGAASLKFDFTSACTLPAAHARPPSSTDWNSGLVHTS